MGYTFQQENEKWAEDETGTKPEGEVADPTGMTGTLDTSGTSGETQTAEDVSGIFDVADEAAAENPVPEGTPAAPAVDPGATGEDALTPDYSQVNTDADGHYAPSNEGDAEINQQTTDTSGTGDLDGSAAVHPGSEEVAADAAAEANGSTGGDDSFDGTKDPGEYKAADVVAFLKDASAADKKKVLKKEEAGDNRKTVVSAAQA